MVWIHGGALVSGESNDYDPTQLVADGVTVVTINYRLGALGFLAHPALADANGQSGDYGLMDQQAALRWVQRNIAASAATRTTSRSSVSPRGPVHAVTGRIATGQGIVPKRRSPRAAPTTSRRRRCRAPSRPGRRSHTGGMRQPDRGLPAQPARLDHPGHEDAAGYTPNINSEVLPETLGTASPPATSTASRSSTARTARMAAVRRAQRTWRATRSRPRTTRHDLLHARGFPRRWRRSIAAKYPLTAFPSPSVALGAVGTDAIFACPALTIDQSVSRFVPTFAYEFNDENAPELFLPRSASPTARPTHPRSSTCWTCRRPLSRIVSPHSSSS
jgi:Carboxylesterase type B